jgi:hypothetical protein
VRGAPAAAQDVASAEALFNRGLEEMNAGHFDAGCPALGESYRLDPRPGTLFTLAECEAKRGRVATAVTRYGDYLALFARLPPDAQAKQKGREKIAAEKKAALSAEVPLLTLSLPKGAPPGTVVKRDAVVLGDASLGVALPVDPGEHVVTTQTPDGGPPTEQRITIAKREKKQITLEVKGVESAAPGAPKASPTALPAESATLPSAPQPDAGGSGRRTGAFIAGGVGVAALALGGITGGLAIRKKATVDSHCEGALCDHEGKLAGDAGKRFATMSTIGFGLGIAGLGTAAVLWLTAPSPAKRADGRGPRPGGASARRATAAVWSAGEGTAVGIQGVW